MCDDVEFHVCCADLFTKLNATKHSLVLNKDKVLYNKSSLTDVREKITFLIQLGVLSASFRFPFFSPSLPFHLFCFLISILIFHVHFFVIMHTSFLFICRKTWFLEVKIEKNLL